MAFDAAAETEGPPRVVSANPLGVQAVGAKIQSLEKGVQHIRDNCARFGTAEDTVAFRTKVEQQVKKAVGLTEDIELGLRRVAAAASGARDDAQQRVISQVQARYRPVKAALVEAVRESLRFLHEYDPSDTHTHVETGSRAAPAPSGGRAAPGQQQRQEVVIELRGFTEVDAAIIEERNAEAMAIAAEAKELQGMFVDFATLVQEQSKQLDVVEAQVEEAHASVKAGNAELEEASKLQKNLRKKYLCFAFLALLIVCIIAVPVVITQAPKW